MNTASLAQSSTAIPPPDYWPTAGWLTDSPSNRGFDETLLVAIEDYVQSNTPYLDSLLIMRNGYIVYEAYFNDYDSSSLHDLASVTKSWTSALVGVAQAEGALTDLDATLPALLPDYFVDELYADKREISLRNLLMMRSGIEFDDSGINTGKYGSPEELLSQDLTAVALGFPIAYQPDQAWNYSSLDSQLISAIVQHAVGESLAEYILPTMFEPMGISEFEWLADATGTTIGGSQLSMTPRDMAKLGLLYLHQGQWDGQQVVPAEWVKLSITPQGDEAIYPPTNQNEVIEWYGYHWWTWKPDWFYGYRSFNAQGYAGQQVGVFPELDLIIVTTANLNGVDPDTAVEQEAGIGSIILDYVFPALTDIELNYDVHIDR